MASDQVEQLGNFGWRPAASEQLNGGRPNPGEQAFTEGRRAS
jgi:hypothetical protein